NATTAGSTPAYMPLPPPKAPPAQLPPQTALNSYRSTELRASPPPPTPEEIARQEAIQAGKRAELLMIPVQVIKAAADAEGRICRLTVDLLDYRSRFRQKAVDVQSTTYSGPFRRGRRDSLAARVGRS